MKWWLLLLLTIIVSHPYITLTAGNPFRSTNTTTGGGKADLSGQYWTWLLRGFKKGYKLGSRYSQWFVKRLLLFFLCFQKSTELGTRDNCCDNLTPLWGQKMVASHISVVNCCVIRRGYSVSERPRIQCRVVACHLSHAQFWNSAHKNVSTQRELFHDNNSIIESQKVNLNHSTVFHYFKSKPLKLGFAWKIKCKLIFCSL